MIYEGNVFQTIKVRLLGQDWLVRVTNKVLTGAVHVPADNSLPGRSPPWRAAQPLLPRRPDDRGHGGDRHGGVAAPRDQGEVRHQRSVGVL